MVVLCRILSQFGTAATPPLGLRRYLSYFDYKALLSDENRKNCIQCLQKQVPEIVRLKIPDDSKCAAVLIPVCISKEGEVSILFTRRSPNMSRHVRQVAFPGGLKEESDKDLEDCALRETEEEIGLPRSRVTIWGSGSLVRPPHTATILPVVGSIENFSLNELKLNKDEVEYSFTVPIEILCAADTKKHTQYKDGYSSPIYVTSDHKIWGITAFITNMFLQCLVCKRIYNGKIEFIKPYRNK